MTIETVKLVSTVDEVSKMLSISRNLTYKFAGKRGYLVFIWAIRGCSASQRQLTDYFKAIASLTRANDKINIGETDSENLKKASFRGKHLTCIDCGVGFIFTRGEQYYYASKGLVKPKRCSDCRLRRKLTIAPEAVGDE